MIRITAEWTALSIKVRKLDAHLCEATTHGNDVLTCMLQAFDERFILALSSQDQPSDGVAF